MVATGNAEPGPFPLTWPLSFDKPARRISCLIPFLRSPFPAMGLSDGFFYTSLFAVHTTLFLEALTES